MSASQIDTLVKMLNQITANLGAYPTDEAAERAVIHLQRFWAPQMRQQLLQQADANQLSPVSKLAVDKLAAIQTAKAS